MKPDSQKSLDPDSDQWIRPETQIRTIVSTSMTPILYKWMNRKKLNLPIYSKNLNRIHLLLKGQCHEIFCFWFFSWISFSQASDYTIRAVSNFFENSRRYSQLKVCHRCQRHQWQIEKTFKQKNFNNFVWTPLGSRITIYIKFCLQVHFKVSAAWYCCHYLPSVSTTPVANLPPVSLIPVAKLAPASLTPVANLPPVSLTPVANLPPVSTALAKMGEKFATGVVDTAGNFAAGVVDTGGKFATGVVDTGGAHWLTNISANFRKNSKRSKWNTLGLGGSWSMKKTRSKKSRDTVPLNKRKLRKIIWG